MKNLAPPVLFHWNPPTYFWKRSLTSQQPGQQRPVWRTSAWPKRLVWETRFVVLSSDSVGSGSRPLPVDLCSDLNLHVDIEKGPNGSLLRPGAVWVHGLVDEPLVVDVGVVHSLQSSIKLVEVQPGKLAKKDGATQSLRAQSAVSAGSDSPDKTNGNRTILKITMIIGWIGIYGRRRDSMRALSLILESKSR